MNIWSFLSPNYFFRAPLKYVVIINFDKSQSPLKMTIVVLSFCGVFCHLLSKHKSCNYSAGLLRKQEIFLKRYCILKIYKVSVNMKEVSAVGQKYVLMNAVLGSPTNQNL